MKLVKRSSVPARSFEKSSRRTFGSVSPDTIKRNIGNIGKGGIFDSYIKSDFDLYSIKDNEPNFFRILPPLGTREEDIQDFMMEIAVHEYMGIDGGWICPKKMYMLYKSMRPIPEWLDLFKMDCPVCGVHMNARMAGDSDKAKSTAPRVKYVMEGFDTSEKPQTEGMLVLAAPPTLKDMILRLCSDPRTADPYNPSSSGKDGREIIFTRERKQGVQYPTYTSAQLGKGFAVPEMFLDLIVPKIDLISIPKYSELEDISKYLANSVTQATEEELPKREVSRSERPWNRKATELTERVEDSEEEEPEEPEEVPFKKKLFNKRR